MTNEGKETESIQERLERGVGLRVAYFTSTESGPREKWLSFRRGLRDSELGKIQEMSRTIIENRLHGPKPR